ncbi:uracil-DNA glycosylase family protein [Chloroflexota bacterium]
MSTLTDLYAAIEQCHECELARRRTRAVPGEGPENASLLFIGEAPGWHEDQQGRPFVGPAGQFLEQLLASIELKREQVYIANVIKCRPPGNRDPLPGEIQTCSKWLDRQIELIKPKIIVTLGRYSMARYFPNESISKVHGKGKRQGDIIYYAMYHPAAALHQGSLRKVIESDMLKIPEILAETEKITNGEAEVKQLNLF